MNIFLGSQKKGRAGIFILILAGSFFISGCMLFFTSCRLYNLERKLTPQYADFISKVRYIITKQEEKIFLELPDSEKSKFIEEFWKRRDPDPDTEENEFKIEYLNRIERANELFFGEGRPGWITDRGRIFILFGPPQERNTNPMDAGGQCSEVWYYPPNFPVVFVDSNCTGNYILSPINLAHLQELNMAQARFQKTFREEKKFFDFSLSVKKTAVTPEIVEGLIIIEVPYAGIWFKSDKDMLQTAFDVHLIIKNSTGLLFWEYKGPFEISMSEDELKQKKGKTYRIEIPFSLKENLDKLRQGKNIIDASVKSRTENEELKKTLGFDL
jgi:GWxTD domain-containing protein